MTPVEYWNTIVIKSKLTVILITAVRRNSNSVYKCSFKRLKQKILLVVRSHSFGSSKISILIISKFFTGHHN